MEKITSYSYTYQGKNFTRKFSSLGSITDYEGERFIAHHEVGSIGLFIAENQFLMLAKSKNVQLTKTIQ